MLEFQISIHHICRWVVTTIEDYFMLYYIGKEHEGLGVLEFQFIIFVGGWSLPLKNILGCIM